MANQQMISAAASSSTSSAASLKEYDVFLSFRGEDTRRTFTSHLHNALIQNKVKTFIDNELEKGDEISPVLLKAIEESHVSIVVFSENYASSKWCLDELSKILECEKDQGQVVMPVFYNVDPSDIRKQTGSYEKAFAKHERDLKRRKDKVRQWKEALTKAANIIGFDSRTYGTDSECIKDIISDVLQKLSPRYPIQLKRQVGIEENYAEIESLLELGSNEVRIIGIWGMGGIGKTTLATALYVRLLSQFDRHCFVANVREESEKLGSNALHKKLFSELLWGKNLRLDALPGVEFNFDMSRLRSTKVLIVLDDVATSQQLEDLMIDYEWLGSGSRVIVTTRNKQVFSQVHEIYEVRKLNFRDSLQLFCLNAFGEKHPKNGYKELSESVVAYCKGIPLALKVLGARLRGRKKEAWESELRKLQKIPNVEMHDVLRLSYDDLDSTEKDIFLDIACFFKGQSRDHVTGLLEAFNFFPAIGIEVLLDMALITISNRNTIEMHDLIQDMGRKIVQQQPINNPGMGREIVQQQSINDPGRRSRLFDPQEVCDVLENNRGTEAVEGIILNLSGMRDLHLSSDSFAKMPNLRFLKFYSDGFNTCNVYFPNGLRSLSNKLRYLQWPRYCLESLPSTFCPEMLVELSMRCSNLQKLWDGVQNLVNLKKIVLACSVNLTEVPDLSMAASLEEVDLAWCLSLRQVHPSILSLHKLKTLNLTACKGIESRKIDIHSKSLRRLNLWCYSALEEFSVASEEMEVLFLGGTEIHELPSSIWRSRKLHLLCLAGCENLNSLGNKLSDDPGVGSLTSLHIFECRQLNASNLYFFIDGLRSLKSLSLIDCCNLQTLPDNIGLLSSLESLNLSGSNVESLSTNIKDLSMLERLELNGCRKLVSVPELPSSLRYLEADGCTSLETIFNLNSVEIPLDGIGLLSSLQDLELSRSNAGSLSTYNKNLRKLKRLVLDNCSKLASIPELPPFLRELSAINCTSLKSLSANIQNLSMLEALRLDNCSKLVSLPELPPSLRVLSAINCTSLEIDFTQQPVLDHDRFFSPKHRLLDSSNYIFLPGAQVPDRFSFRTTETSITIPYRLQSDLCGFIVCLVLSQSLSFGKYRGAECIIYEHGERVRCDFMRLHFDDCFGSARPLSVRDVNFISDHVFLCYCGISRLRKIQKSGAYDHDNLSFQFNIKHKGSYKSGEGIKGCGVIPVYGWELELDDISEELESDDNSEDIVELEPNAQSFVKQEPQPPTNNLKESVFQQLPLSVKDIDELQPRAIGIGVGGSNHENEDDQEALLPTRKLQEVMHQTTATGTQKPNREEDLKEKSSCDCFIGHLLRHLWRLVSTK